jgi:hypothetical protein
LYSSKKSKKLSNSKNAGSSSNSGSKEDPNYDHLFGWSPIMSALYSNSRSSFPALYLSTHFQSPHNLPLESKLKLEALMEWIKKRGCPKIEYLNSSRLEGLTIGNEKGHQGVILKAKKLEIEKMVKLGEWDEERGVYSRWSSEKESVEVEFEAEQVRKKNRKVPFFVGMFFFFYFGMYVKFQGLIKLSN